MIKAFSRIKKTTYNPTLLSIATPCAPKDTLFSIYPHFGLFLSALRIKAASILVSSFQFRDPARHATLTLAAFDADPFLLHHKTSGAYDPLHPSPAIPVLHPHLPDLVRA